MKHDAPLVVEGYVIRLLRNVWIAEVHCHWADPNKVCAIVKASHVGRLFPLEDESYVGGRLEGEVEIIIVFLLDLGFLDVHRY